MTALLHRPSVQALLILMTAALCLSVLLPPLSPADAAPVDVGGTDSNEATPYAGWFRDVWDSPFRDDIVWLAEEGITNGCAEELFCGDRPITRAQFATMLDRALDLPAASVDHFGDDAGSLHEPAINRLASAAITNGCAVARYCPSAQVTRAQAASLLARALSLPAASSDYFVDDGGLVHESSINRLRAAKITYGCGSGRYCPGAALSREQAAALLRRSLAPEETTPSTPTSGTPTPSPSSAPAVTPSTTTSPSPTPMPATPTPAPSPSAAPTGQLLIDSTRLMTLPTSGTAWDALVAASAELGPIVLSDQDEVDDVRLLAKALVTVRTGGSVAPIHAALAAVPGTEVGGRTLALGRNLAPVVLAADLTGYHDASFRSWLYAVIRTPMSDGRTLIQTHEQRPNNWGTHAGASRVAVDLYLGDATDLARAIAVFRGWLGDRSAYASFKYGELDWQADPSKPVGINPPGATKNGHDIDGVLPDDQRRSGGFTWPPPKENYVYEALQGGLLQAELLYRAGYASYSWSSNALLRAFRWLHEEAAYPAEGDDTWQPHLVNVRYGTSFPAPSPARFGKGFGFADWLYGR